MEPASEQQAQVPASATVIEPIAPLWHTLLLVAFIVLFSFLGASSQRTVGQGHREWLYLGTIVIEWIMFAYIYWGIRKAKRTTVRELIGGRWNTPEDFLLDVAVAAVFWIAAMVVLGGLGYAMGLSGHGKAEETKKVLSFLTPQNLRQALMFGALCITAGFCEEFIFRGYFQKQFAAAAKNVYVGIVGSAIVFGLGHGYEGLKRMLLIGVYGLMFGILAHFRKSLRPGMMAHTWHDAFTGLVLYLISKLKLV